MALAEKNSDPIAVEMPQNSKKSTASPVLTKEETRELNMVMGNINNSNPKLTEKHINQLIRQKEIGMNFQHKDTQRILDIEAKKPEHAKQILLGFAIFLLLLICVVGFFDKTYIESILKILAGFCAGSGAGYFVGKKDSNFDSKNT